MPEQERGALLVKQENLNDNIANTKRRLARFGEKLKELSNSISEHPEKTTFSNAPPEFSDIPQGLTSIKSLNWPDIPTLEEVAQSVIDLQKDIIALSEIKRHLKNQ